MPQASMRHLSPVVLDYDAAKAVGEDKFLRHLRKQMNDAIRDQGVTGAAMKRSVYVVRLKGAFLISYPKKESPTIYIGRGDAQPRLASHLKKWMHHVHNFGSDTTVEVNIILPLRQGRLDYFKYVEGSLLFEHERIYGAIPLFNGRRETTYGEDIGYTAEQKTKLRALIGVGRGKRPWWSLSPTNANPFMGVFLKGMKLE